MSNDLVQFLQKNAALSDALKVKLHSILKQAFYKKKAFLLREGQICNKIFFVEKGLVRTYYIKEGLEFCSGLLCEQSIVVSVKSFFQQEISDEYIEAIEDTYVHYISYDELEMLYNDFPEFNVIGRKLITEYYVMSEIRNYILRRHSAVEKMKLFDRHFGHLMSRVPRKDIASYLGLNLETLSRISN